MKRLTSFFHVTAAVVPGDQKEILNASSRLRSRGEDWLSASDLAKLFGSKARLGRRRSRSVAFWNKTTSAET